MSNRLFRILSIAAAVEATLFALFFLLGSEWIWLVLALVFGTISAVAVIMAGARRRGK